MNPLDLLTARQRIDAVMREAEPTAPQIPDRLSRAAGRPRAAGSVRRATAASLHWGGRMLLAMSKRLEPAAPRIPLEQCDS